MKRTILFLLLLLSSIESFAYFSAVSPSGHTLYYDFVYGSNGNVEVAVLQHSEFSSSLVGALVIPSTVTYNGNTYSVTTLAYQAFWNCSGLTSVTIGNSVTTIGQSAFYNCSGLTSVTIPNSVTSIGRGAFDHCSGLTSVTIPNSVTTIGESAFYNCNSLTIVTIGNSVTTIGQDAFWNCSGLTSVTIGNSVTTIGQSAFRGCSSLTSVTIPNSVTTIGNSAFGECRGLTSVTIGNSVTSIGQSAFWGCSGLTSVTIGNSVTTIGDNAFLYCSSLTSVTIPNSVTSIGNNAFGQVRLVRYCGSATGRPWGARIAGCFYEEGDFLFEDNTKTKLCAYIGTSSSVTIPNSVTSIGDYAFYGCFLTEITSEARTAPLLGEYAFNGVNIQIPVNIPCGTLASYMSRWSYFSNFVEDAGSSFEVSSNNPAMGYVTVLTQPTCTAPHAVVNAVANPGYRFVRWDNGVTDNPYALDLISDTTLVAIFESASTQGVDDVMMNSCNITTRDGMIVVKGAEGELLRIFDIEGRVIVSERVEEGKQYSMPHSGVYMVQVGKDPAQKVVVVK